MKKTFLFTFAFICLFAGNIFGQKDPTPQKPSVDTITSSSERQFWDAVNSALSETPLDSSNTKTKRYVVHFQGVKMQAQKNKMSLLTVNKWELVQNKIIVIFTDDDKIVFSFKPLLEYKQIVLDLEIGEKNNRTMIYVPNNPKNKELEKLRIRI